MQSLVSLWMFLALSIAACSPSSEEPQAGACGESLRALSDDPAAAAAKAAAGGDFRLLAVDGYTRSFPGAEDELVTRLGYRVLKDTTDDVTDASCEAYQEVARRYAEGYNRKMKAIVAIAQPNS